MDRQAVRAAFDEQIRRHPEADAPDGLVEHDDGVIRSISGGDGWTGVIWCDLDDGRADAAIAAQISRFADLSRPWEWKHYSYDQPPTYRAAARRRFDRDPPEALLVAEIADLALDVPPPPGVELRAVMDQQGVEALVAVHERVFGEDHSALGSFCWPVSPSSRTVAAVVAFAGETPISAGRVEFHSGTDFASLWGGGTLPAWRGRGVSARWWPTGPP